MARSRQEERLLIGLSVRIVSLLPWTEQQRQGRDAGDSPSESWGYRFSRRYERTYGLSTSIVEVQTISGIGEGGILEAIRTDDGASDVDGGMVSAPGR